MEIGVRSLGFEVTRWIRVWSGGRVCGAQVEAEIRGQVKLIGFYGFWVSFFGSFLELLELSFYYLKRRPLQVGGIVTDRLNPKHLGEQDLANVRVHEYCHEIDHHQRPDLGLG